MKLFAIKKHLTTLLLLGACLAISVGCGKAATPKPKAKALVAPVATTKDTAAKSPGKVLVAYYSYSKDHNTKVVAEQIKSLTGGDLVEITPKTPYPTDYQTTVDQGKKEVNAGFQPEITTKVANWQEYDTVIIGSPIWWFHVAPPVSTFMHKNDFKGKQVALFVTHGGYGGGESANDIQSACQGAKVLGTYVAPGADVEKDKAKVEEWLKKIEIIK